MDYSVIIPVYDGEKTLRTLTERVIRELNGQGSFELIFVFDEGKISSWEALKVLESEYRRTIRIYRLDRNYGQHNAILFGVSKSEGDFIITMDEDLQHDPGYIRDLISKQRELNSDVVYARFKDLRHSISRSAASAMLRRTLKYLIPGMGYYSSYRLITRRIALGLLAEKSSYTFIDAGLFRLKARIDYIEVDHKENGYRESTYNFFKLLAHFLQIILAYTPILKWTLACAVLLTSLAVPVRHYSMPDSAKWFLFSGAVLFIISITGYLYKRGRIEVNTVPCCLHEAN